MDAILAMYMTEIGYQPEESVPAASEK